jgi:hypothetical protein
MHTPFFVLYRAKRRGVPCIDSIEDPCDKMSFGGVKSIDGAPPFSARVSGGSGWTDCLNTHPSSLPLILSGTVVREIVAARIEGARFAPLELKLPKRLKKNPDPYFCLLPEGKALGYLKRYFIRSEGAGKDRLVGEIHEGEKFGEKFDYWVRIPIAESWDGADVMPFHYASYIGAAGATVCSRKFLQLAHALKWHNLAAAPLDSRITGPIFELDKASWPPETWYDERYPQYDWKANWPHVKYPVPAVRLTV